MTTNCSRSFSPAIAWILTVAGLLLPPVMAAAPSDQEGDSRAVAELLQIQRYPSYFHRNLPLTPEVELVLRFSGPVDLKTAEKAIAFSDRKSGQRITVKVGRPPQEAIESMQPWGDDGKRLQWPLEQFLTVAPRTPLPTGSSWQLAVDPMTSSDGKRELVNRWVSNLGTLNEFKANSIRAINRYDVPNHVQIYFNKSIDENLDDEALAGFVRIEPEPENLAIDRSSSSLRLTGDFEYGRSYQVTVFGGLPAYDETHLDGNREETLSFQPNDGFLSLPAYAQAQSAAGAKRFDILTGNLKSVRVRIKQLSDRDLVYAMRGYDKVYAGYGGEKSIPFEMVPGRVIYDEEYQRTAKIDQSEKITLEFGKILKENPHAALYICAEGWSDTKKSRGVGAQAIIQLTDLGLAWKQELDELLVYAFSLKTGKPLANVGLEALDGEAEPLAEFKTDGKGLAKISRDRLKQAKWLGASRGNDRHLMKTFGRYDAIRLWQFSIPYRYDQPEETERRTLLFTDRGVYRPGETVYLKCLSRLTDNDQLLPMGKAAGKARVRMTDPRNRTVYSGEASLSRHGTFDLAIDLPEGKAMGYYSIEVDFNDPEHEVENPYRLRFRHGVRVADYRPNTFEITLDDESVADEKKDFEIPVSANYYMGKALSKARLSWRVQAGPTWPRVRGFDDFRFGNSIDRRDSFSATETMDLSESGEGVIGFTLPDSDTGPSPMRVNVSAEITDLNQQTIVESLTFVVDSSEFYLGVRTPDELVRAGETMTLSLAALTNDGKAHGAPIEGTLKVEKVTYHTVKVKGAGGRITHRNESELEDVLSRPVTITTKIEPETGLPIPAEISLALAEAGDYQLTFSAEDKAGNAVQSKIRLRVIGADEPSWTWHDGIKIDVTPDKEAYQVGDTAKLLLRTPVLGHALITVERAGVQETLTRKISEHETVLELPIKAGAAPNVFASVLIVRGMAQSPHEHPETDYRVGYCQLKVTDPAASLEVAIDHPDPSPYQLPGAEVTLGARVKDHLGKPVRGAEVTLYAVDEGVLSLTGYATPAPAQTFHAPFPLAVLTGQTISDLLPENPREFDFGNKGYVIGGGGPGGEGIDPNQVRKDFKSLAFWKGALVTDAKGRVATTFKAPDSLTSYRVIAVACDENRFGSAEDRLVVNKPLIIQPALPAFGNAGDKMDLSAILHNNTEGPIELEVRVELDEHADFLPEIEGRVTTALTKTGTGDHPDLRVRRIKLAAGETSKVGFPALFTKKGEAIWRWRAVEVANPELIDSVESRLSVGYPMPLLREVLSYRLEMKGESSNLIAEVDPRVMSHRGEINVTVSNSRVLEALDAIDYLLRYPYGCVEQTTSSTLPWLMTRSIRDAVPQLQRTEAEIDEAVAQGTRRLLSMQTSEGGLSYWPGGDKPMLWGSAYGGMALALAKRQGVDLPEERLEALWKYLSQQMRDTAKVTNTYDLYQRSLVAYTLALAGKSEPSYHELLYRKREDLSRDSRALLALAMMESTGEGEERDAVMNERITALLAEPEEEGKENTGHWYRKHFSVAMQLLAWSQWDPLDERPDQLLEELLGVPRGRTAWGNTYLNSWGLMAVIHQATATASALEGTTCTVSFGDQSKELSFAKALKGELVSFGFDEDSRKIPLRVNLDSRSSIFAHVEVAGYPKIVPRDPENHGLGIDRTYHRLEQDGSVSPVDSLEVGDLVLVTLHLDLPENQRFNYLAIDDPLPSVLEAVNPSFETQAGHGQVAFKGDWKQLYCHHRELRTDRALFFCDYLYQGGHHAVQYLARVVAPGEVTAPPAKVELMYEPQRFGLSGTLRVISQPLKLRQKDQVVQQ